MWVDLPGLGYAAVAHTQRQQWSRSIRYYLQYRQQLRLTCVLIDARHPPSSWDIALMELLEEWERPFVIVMTKCDQLPTTAVQERKTQIESLLQAYRYGAEVIPTSARTGLGRNVILAIIRRYCLAPE